MKKKIRYIIGILTLNILFFSAFSPLVSNLSMLTGQMGINATLATQVVGMLNAGLTVWGILGLLATFNAIGAGVLFAAKKSLKKMSAKAVIAW